MNLGRWDLWNPDEPRYAEVAREMMVRGDYILMHLNGNIYLDKPPLYFWLVELSSFLFQGFTSFSVRFPAAFFGTLAVLLTYFLGRSLFGAGTGFISGFILATSFEFAFRSTRGNIDSTLTFFTTASLLCFIHWYRSSKQEGEDDQDSLRFPLYGFYVGMALATLTKGPVGFLLPLLVSLFFLLSQKDWKAVKGMRLLTGMLLTIGLVLLWYAPSVWRGGESYLQETLFRQSLARLTQGWAKLRPIYYYLYTFPGSFLPWSIFLPAALVYGLSKETNEKRKEFLFLFAWFAVIFLFFSLSKGKRALYLLPLFPAAAILVGKLWHDLISGSIEIFRRQWISIPIYGLSGAGALCGAVIPWVISVKFPTHVYDSLPVAFLLLGSSLGAFFVFRTRRDNIVLTLIVGMSATGFFYTQHVIFPKINPIMSARFMSQEISSRISASDKLCVYGKISTEAYNFYTGIVPIKYFSRPKDLFQFLKSTGRVFCILTFEDYSRFQAMKDNPGMQLVARHAVGKHDVVLISNR
jgi:4-amino-4-deoxy-L-arabinose transferase-like glycosyltransferase